MASMIDDKVTWTSKISFENVTRIKYSNMILKWLCKWCEQKFFNWQFYDNCSKEMRGESNENVLKIIMIWKGGQMANTWGWWQWKKVQNTCSHIAHLELVSKILLKNIHYKEFTNK